MWIRNILLSYCHVKFEHFFPDVQNKLIILLQLKKEGSFAITYLGYIPCIVTAINLNYKMLGERYSALMFLSLNNLPLILQSFSWNNARAISLLSCGINDSSNSTSLDAAPIFELHTCIVSLTPGGEGWMLALWLRRECNGTYHPRPGRGNFIPILPRHCSLELLSRSQSFGSGRAEVGIIPLISWRLFLCSNILLDRIFFVAAHNRGWSVALFRHRDEALRDKYFIAIRAYFTHISYLPLALVDERRWILLLDWYLWCLF